jgi:cyanate permease
VALFTFTLVVLNFAWNVALPYQIAAIARVDSTGRLLVLLPAFQAAGATAGPALAGRIAGERDFDAIYALLAVCAAIAFVGFVALAVTRPSPKISPRRGAA